MKIKIKSRFKGDVILSGEYNSIKDCLQQNSEADLSEADLRGANLSEANLSEADLRGANLSGANLSEADLSEAHLSEADLSEADLSGANLSEAGLREALIFIHGSRHQLQYNKEINELRIGCHVHSLDKWLKSYKSIGDEECYTEEQIEEYKQYMDMLAVLK